jgi:hypothetical protein
MNDICCRETFHRIHLKYHGEGKSLFSVFSDQMEKEWFWDNLTYNIEDANNKHKDDNQ